MKKLKVKGIHHLSAISKDPQENVDFYSSFLGMPLIRKAVNFDNANTYHVYFGNDKADIGTITTFFPWGNNIKEGIIGDGQVGISQYAIPLNSNDFWKERLRKYNIPYYEIRREQKEFIHFRDVHGTVIELVEDEMGSLNEWEFNDVFKKNAIKHIHGAVLFSKKPLATKEFLIDDLGLKLVIDSALYYQFEMDSIKGKYIYLYKEEQGIQRLGAKAVHHIAFSVNSDEIDSWHQFLNKKYDVSIIKDRDFFRSIYFKEPGGITIELATDKPGFNGKDNDVLAKELYLPKQYEKNRNEILEKLNQFTIRKINKFEHYYNDEKNSLRIRLGDYLYLSQIRKLTEEEKKDREEIKKLLLEIINKEYLEKIGEK